LSYFCTMKRFVTYCFIAVTLFIGVASGFMPGSDIHHSSAKTIAHQQKLPDDHQSFFSASDLLLSVGMNNEQIRLTHSVQNISCRIFSSSLNAFRIQHSTQIENQKFCTRTTLFLLNSANKQLDGYYLYHLRKLLI